MIPATESNMFVFKVILRKFKMFFFFLWLGGNARINWEMPGML